MSKKILNFFKKDFIFTISFFLAIVSCYMGRFSLKFIDLKVIITLFSLMLIVETLKESDALKKVAEIIIRHSKTKRTFIQLLIVLSFISSMFFTNDVAVLALLPIFLSISKTKFSKKESIQGVVLIILSANLGSSVFPTGNPQNIFIFSYYRLNIITFINWMFPFFVLSIISLTTLSYLVPKEKLTTTNKLNIKTPISIDIRIIISLVLMIGYISNILSSPLIIFVVILLILLTSVTPLKKIDFKLLFTFIFFFLIVGNLSENHFISSIIIDKIGDSHSTLWISAIISQVISNVPSALLLSPFTVDSHSILIGTNIGGMGTLIASLANLIGYNIFKSYEDSQTKYFLKYFSLINFGLLIIYLIIFTLI